MEQVDVAGSANWCWSLYGVRLSGGRATYPWFGRRLRELREEVGLTQAKLGERAGMSQPAIARYERGDGDPHWSTVEKLAEALGVTIDRFATPRFEYPGMTADRAAEVMAMLDAAVASDPELPAKWLNYVGTARMGWVARQIGVTGEHLDSAMRLTFRLPPVSSC